MVPAAIRHLLRTTPTVAPVPHRALLYLSGSQATQFLNAILASTVVSPPRGPFFSALLHAQGRVLYDLFVYPKKNERGDDGYMIEYDPRPIEALQLHSTLKRFILRSKVKIEDVSDQYDVWAIWGSEKIHELDTPRQWIWSQSGIGEPQWAATDRWPWGVPDDERIILHDRRTVGMGARLLVRKGDKPHEIATHDIVGTHDYTLHRILHGVPEGIVDIPPLQAFPMESNLDVMGGLDFRKGCYIGQELTVRTYHTGILRKRVLPVMICDDRGMLVPESAVIPNSEVLATYSDNSPSKMPKLRGRGKILMTTRGVGLALMRLEQVELAEKGLLEFRANLRDEDEDSNFPNAFYKVLHWLPAWWPK